jgi:hypothetical protein
MASRRGERKEHKEARCGRLASIASNHCVSGCFHAHAHWLLQLSVRLLRLTVAVVESAFNNFATFRIQHRYLLEAGMKIYLKTSV